MASSGVLVDGPHAEVNAAVAGQVLVDHHVHSLVRDTPDRTGYLAMLTESDRPGAVAGWDTQLGIAVRRWCASPLGLEPFPSGDAFLDRRLAMGAEDAVGAFVAPAGIDTLLVDTGFQADALIALPALAALARARVEPVVRLEAVAERLAGAGVSASGYPSAFRAAIAEALPTSVAFKTVLAYRGGLEVDADPPTDADVVAAAGRWLAEVERSGRARLTDRVLLRFGIWEAARTGRPLQVHTGFGDSDLDMHRADPSLLTPFLRRTEGVCPVMLLHTYPFHRTAGYLAQMFGHVHVDVGLAVNHTGVASDRIVAESLELAPLTRVLFSSDAWGLPELVLLGSLLFRRGLARALGRWVADGDWPLGDAIRAVELIGRENARRVYGLRD
ncbi:MAG: amidohydrolase family protein [Chloroflexota bacterium]